MSAERLAIIEAAFWLCLIAFAVLGTWDCWHGDGGYGGR